MNMKPTLWASALAAVGASLCCVAPLVLVSLGLGGAWLSTLTELEPYRPIFVVLALGLLALAGHKLYRQPAVCEPGRACADGGVQRRQRLIFWAVAALLLLLLAFPWYASLFY
ncbi:MAG: mercury transporter MerT [Hydrogenophilales bacterium 17-61-9]|nr:MAG: mercury transporter MerT [Hydrogenophilales bacterium 17-61-9]